MQHSFLRRRSISTPGLSGSRVRSTPSNPDTPAARAAALARSQFMSSSNEPSTVHARGTGLGRLRRWVRFHVDLRSILREIETPAFREIESRYRHAAPDPGYSKYLDARTWVGQKLQHAYALGLHQCRGLKCLDLGTGPAYFPLVCRHLGHTSVGLDVDDVAMYNDLISHLRIERRIVRIDSFKPLPDLGGPFDLVTAFMICFNRHNQPDLWGPDEWSFFLSDLAQRHLKPDARIFLSLNPEATNGLPYDEPLKHYFQTLGAHLSNCEVVLSAESVSHAGSAARPRS